MFTDTQQQQTFTTAREQAQHLWPKPIVTEIVPLKHFYLAEDEHQDYYQRQPLAGYCQIVINPKITKAREAYADWFIR